MKQEIKVGDRVRSKELEYEGVVVFAWGKLLKIELSDGTVVVHHSQDLEVVSPEDKRTAFLAKLGALLREYGVYFIAHKTDMPISAYFDDAEDYRPFASIGKEGNKGCGVVVTADNVMDFERE